MVATNRVSEGWYVNDFLLFHVVRRERAGSGLLCWTHSNTGHGRLIIRAMDKDMSIHHLGVQFTLTME